VVKIKIEQINWQGHDPAAARERKTAVEVMAVDLHIMSIIASIETSCTAAAFLGRVRYASPGAGRCASPSGAGA